MCNRRNKPVFHGTIFLALVGGLAYTFYLYNLTKIDLETSRSDTNKILKHQESLSSQLQVVYEHRARLERSLQKEKTDHKNTKLEFSKKQNDFLLNITRSKHEAMNRFNSLETQYNMLKAQSKELDTDYNRLQQTYSRLSAEHIAVTNQQRRNFQLFKEQKANQIASFEEEIRTLKQQVVALRTHLRSKADEVEQYKVSSSRALAVSQQYQEQIKDLQRQLLNYRERLNSYVSQSKAVKSSSREVKQDNKKEHGESRHQLDGNAFGLKTTKSKVEPDESLQERENRTVHLRSDGKQNQDRSRRYVKEQVIPPSDNDADDADMRQSPDENVDEQKQVNEGYSQESRNGIKANEGYVPLRDYNGNGADVKHGLKVVSPEDTAMNKWANILKQAAEQGHKESNKVISKEFAGEAEEGKNRQGGEIAAVAGDINDQRQLGEEEVIDKQDDKPVVNQFSDAHRMEAAKSMIQGGQMADRPAAEQENKDNNQLSMQAGHVADRPTEQKDEREKEQEEEGKNEDGGADLSRENMNRQVAEMRENYQQEQEKQGEHVGAAQPQQYVQRQAEEHRTQQTDAVQSQQHVAPIPPVQRQAEEHRTQQADAVQSQQHVAPIPPVQRQAEEHGAQQADADDEDADNGENDQDPDEKDPDDADEAGDDVHHGDRTLKGAKKQHNDQQA